MLAAAKILIDEASRPDDADRLTFLRLACRGLGLADGGNIAMLPKVQANQSVENFLAGKNEDVHTAVLATQRADLSFELFMQVRNKVVSAYQEIMRMQV